MGYQRYCPNGTEANAAGRSGNARELRKQSSGMIQEGKGNWPNSSENLQKARYLWVLRTLQNCKEEGARAWKLVSCQEFTPFAWTCSVGDAAAAHLTTYLVRCRVDSIEVLLLSLLSPQRAQELQPWE